MNCAPIFIISFQSDFDSCFVSYLELTSRSIREFGYNYDYIQFPSTKTYTKTIYTKTTQQIMVKQMKENPTPELTKEEILKILKEENPKLGKDYTQYILIIEYKKLNESLGIVKGELYKNDTTEYRASLLMPNPKGATWEDIGIGKSKFYGLTFDTREESIAELIGGFFRRSLKEGKLQDLIPR